MANYNGQFQDSSSNILLPTPHSYANIEGATASQAYVKGQMIVYQNRLCEVTAAIASGADFVIGTNIAYKNVGDIGQQLVANDGTEFYFDVLDGKYGYYPSATKTPAEFVPFGGSGIDSFENIVTATSGATRTAYTFTFTVDANEAILIAHENLSSSTPPDYSVVFSSNIEAHKIGPDYTPRMGNYENRFKLYHLKNVTTNSTVTIGQSTSSPTTYFYALFY